VMSVSPRPAAGPVKPQPCATAALPPSWHAYPGGNTLTGTGGVGAEEAGENMPSHDAARTAAALPAKGLMLPAPPGLGPRPRSPAPLRRDGQAQGLPGPRAPPAR